MNRLHWLKNTGSGILPGMSLCDDSAQRWRENWFLSDLAIKMMGLSLKMAFPQLGTADLICE
jgi:hypothetical protein